MKRKYLAMINVLPPQILKKENFVTLTIDLINGYTIHNGAEYFVKGGQQNYLVYQPVLKYFQTFSSTDIISVCKSKGLSEENFKAPVTLDSSFAPKLAFTDNKVTGTKFKGIYLIKDNIHFTNRNVEYFFIVYRDVNTDLTPGDCLSGTVKLT